MPSHDDLAERLADAEAALAAVAAGAVDAVASAHGPDPGFVGIERADSFFVALVTEMQEATASLDATGTVLYANPRFAELLDLPPARVLGRTLAELTSSPSRAAAAKLLTDAAAGPARATLDLERGDGRLVPASLSATPISGTRLEICLVVTDLTERRLAEAALREVEERFRTAFEKAPIGMTLVNLDGRYDWVNETFSRIVGYTAEQLAGCSRESITHPDDIDADRAALGALLAGESPTHTSEKRYLHASGRAVWVAASITLIRDAERQPQHFITQVQDITERRDHERQLQHLADHDPLTDLLNRRSFERELHSHAVRAQRYRTLGAVLMLDLDNFKYFNDTQGHKAGDELIARIAAGLQSRLRASDVLARLGGDEFAVLLPGGDKQETESVAAALLQLVRDESASMSVGEHKSVTASIGIARFDDRANLTADQMMVNADLAMYEAKEAGRDRVASYRTDQHDRPRIESRMKRVEQINEALAYGRFELLAQPVVPLSAELPAQYELLLRMRDRHGDLLLPASFLGVAERVGLVRQIDRWVARRAIEMVAEQQAAGRAVNFEINLSGPTIGDDRFLHEVERRLCETSIRPECLIFEIAETAAVPQFARAAAFAARLADLGCRFALDDFGAGFGSFYYLKHLPFDFVKIDGEFVSHCVDNVTDRILIAAVVEIARKMGKATIAELVPSQEAVEVLTNLGVDYGQGFYLGPPAPLEEHLAAMNAAPT